MLAFLASTLSCGRIGYDPRDLAGTGGSGSGGAGGATDSGLLALCDKAKWHTWITGNATGDVTPPFFAIDGTPANAYQSRRDQDAASPIYLQLDFHGTVALDGISLDYTTHASDYPRSYEVSVSNALAPTPADTVVAGIPAPPTMAAPFIDISFGASQTGRYLRITETGSAAHWWSVPELNVTGCRVVPSINPIGSSWDGGISDVTDRSKWVIVAFNASPAAKMVDGDPGTVWPSGTDPYDGIWFEVDLGAVGDLHGLVLSHRPGDIPAELLISASTDGIDYVDVASALGADVMDIPFATQSRYLRVTNVGSRVGSWWSVAELNLRP